MNDQRSTISQVSLQEVLDATTSAKQATLYGQQQYQTPTWWAAYFAGLLPGYGPQTAVDWQVASGNLFSGFGYQHRFGFEIDRRFADVQDGIDRILIDCNRGWELLDELFPDMTWECQVANPPFGIQWPEGESTEVTWRQVLKRACPGGYGYFIASRRTIERLGIDRHPWVYLYQTFPPGMFKGTDVEAGVVHWFNAPDVPKPVAPGSSTPATARVHFVPQGSIQSDRGFVLETGINVPCQEDFPVPGLAETATQFVKYWTTSGPVLDARGRTDWYETEQAWKSLSAVVKEEHAKRPPWNIWLADDGSLRIYLSLRFQIKRKLSRDDIVRLQRVDKCHPLALTVEVDTRILLRELIDTGAYIVQPEAEAAIRSALEAVARVSAPIMPVTDFERVAYADELGELVVREDYAVALMNARLGSDETAAPRPPAFTPGRRYSTRTGAYRFVESFVRRKPVFEDSDDADDAPVQPRAERRRRLTTVDHQCELTGSDRYVEAVDDDGITHRFLEHPETCDCKRDVVLHPESSLWGIFVKPEVPTLADLLADEVEANRKALIGMQVVGQTARAAA